MSNKHLIIVTSVYPPDVGGPAVYFASLKDVMVKNGWDVEVLVRPGFWDLCRRLNTPHPTSPRRGEGFTVLAHATPAVLLPVLFARIFICFKLVIRTGGDYFWERAVEEGRFHGTLREFYGKKFQVSSFKFQDRLLFWLLGLAFRNSDVIVFTTNFLKDIYTPLFRLKESKISVITHPVPNYDYKYSTHDPDKLKPKSYKLLYAGRFLKLKNLEMLLEAFAEALNKHSELKLIIIGQGPEEHRLRNVCQTLDLANAVTFKKPIDHAMILGEMAASDLVVLPSLSDVSPNLLMDARATGTPVLATRENGCHQIIGDAGVWFDPESREDLAEKLEHVLAPGELEKLRGKMRNHPYKKTWSDVAEEYETIMSNI